MSPVTQAKEASSFKAFLVRHRFFLICLFMVLLRFAFCLRISGRQSFACDEIAELGFIAKANSLQEILMYFLTTEITNLPLFALIAAGWYRIVPWGEAYLLLLCELFTSAGILVLGAAAARLKDELTGYISVALCVISSTLLLRCDMEYRCYSFLFLMVTICFYWYVRGKEKGCERGIRYELVFALIMTLLAYSHYFGPLIIVALFISEAFLFIKKKNRISFIIPYVVSGALLTPWFLLMLKFKEKSISDFWPSPPNLGSIPEMLRFVMSNDEGIYILALMGMVYTVVLALNNIIKKEYDYSFDHVLLTFLWITLFILLGDFVYSSRINIYGSIWVDKYFISVLPAMVIMTAVFLRTIPGLLCRGGMKPPEGVLTAVLCVFLILYTGLGNYYHDVKEYMDVPLDPFRETAQYLAENTEGEEKTLLLLPMELSAAKGYQEYYIDHYGLADRIEVVSWAEPELSSILAGADRLYVFDVRNRIEKTGEELGVSLEGFSPEKTVKEYDLTLYKK